jgi:hypothetical protein
MSQADKFTDLPVRRDSATPRQLRDSAGQALGGEVANQDERIHRRRFFLLSR